MLLRITKWICFAVAGAFSVTLLFMSWLVLSFGGLIFQWFYLAVLIPPALCLPLFILFCFQRKWGIVLLTLNLFCFWLPYLIGSFPRISFGMFIDSGLSRFVLGFWVSSMFAYFLDRYDRLTTSEGGS